MKNYNNLADGNYTAIATVDGGEPHAVEMRKNKFGWWVADHLWRYGTPTQPFANWAGQCGLEFADKIQSYFQNLLNAPRLGVKRIKIVSLTPAV